MKTFIELDWLPMAALQAPRVHFGRQNRLYGRFTGLQRWVFSQMRSIWLDQIAHE